MIQQPCSNPLDKSRRMTCVRQPCLLTNSMRASRGEGNRTPNRWFWRPVLYQLSYTPKQTPGSLWIRAAEVTDQGQLHQTINLPICQHSEYPKTLAGRLEAYPTIYSTTLVTTPEPTVLPPSRMANRTPSSMAIGLCSVTIILTLSPGMHMSAPLRSAVPVTSVVRK